MSIELYYFSGTGNSLFVAKELAAKTDGKLIAIASLYGDQLVSPQAETVGIVFPVYYSGLPLIVERFAKRIVNIERKYVFCVCTYGGGLGTVAVELRAILKQRGGTVSAAFGVHMPQNAFRKPWERPDRIYQRAMAKIARIAPRIEDRRNGMLLSDRALYLALSPFRILFRALYKRSLAKLSDYPEKGNTEGLIQWADKTFSVEESCNACGICVQVCPVGNIQMANGRPKWQHGCENCLACYNWCPPKAILGGIAQRNYHYSHSAITVQDIIRQNPRRIAASL